MLSRSSTAVVARGELSRLMTRRLPLMVIPFLGGAGLGCAGLLASVGLGFGCWGAFFLLLLATVALEGPGAAVEAWGTEGHGAGTVGPEATSGAFGVGIGAAVAVVVVAG